MSKRKEVRQTHPSDFAGPDVVLMEITPELALEWLTECNTHNRHLTQSRVDRLAAAIVRGEWKVNGEAIKFAGDPRVDKSTATLLDGQHRLQAFMEQTVYESLPTFVMFNVEMDAQETMDRGKSRSLADVLHLRGEANARDLASAISLAFHMSQGTHRAAGRANITPAQATTMLEQHPGIRDSVMYGRSVYNRGVKIPPSILAVSHYQFAQIDYVDCTHFFDSLTSGVGLEEGSPILALRRYIDLSHNEKGNVDNLSLHAVLIKAWNAYRDGRKVKVLSFKRGGASPESWPTPK